MTDPVVKASKFLSLILRHDPGKIGLELDAGGWANINELLDKLAERGRPLTRQELEHVVATNNKQRFAISEDGAKIRASQGHSIDIDLGLDPKVPPDMLYHGTATRNESSIRGAGLIKQSRQHVHLSEDTETATKVAIRHGKPLILRVDARQMHADGFAFFQSENGVWLTDHVPAKYLSRD